MVNSAGTTTYIISDYEKWHIGAALPMSRTTVSRFRYTGHEFDTETRHHYSRSRFSGVSAHTFFELILAAG
jgi:hypothetical protein